MTNTPDFLKHYAENFNCTDCKTYPELRTDLLPDIHVGRLLHGVMGVITELQELEEAEETWNACDDEVSLHNYKEELGDLLWFASLCALSVRKDNAGVLGSFGSACVEADIFLKEGLFSGLAGSDEQHANRYAVEILDRLKSLIFYNSNQIKIPGSKDKGDPSKILTLLVDILMGKVFTIIGRAGKSLGYFPIQDFLQEVSMKNLAKLQARHKGAAVSDARDYEKEKQAMDAVK